MFSTQTLETFVDCLRIAGLGMLGVFVFMAVFAGLILGLGKILPEKQNAGTERGE